MSLANFRRTSNNYGSVPASEKLSEWRSVNRLRDINGVRTHQQHGGGDSIIFKGLGIESLRYRSFARLPHTGPPLYRFSEFSGGVQARFRRR